MRGKCQQRALGWVGLYGASVGDHDVTTPYLLGSSAHKVRSVNLALNMTRPSLVRRVRQPRAQSRVTASQPSRDLPCSCFAAVRTTRYAEARFAPTTSVYTHARNFRAKSRSSSTSRQTIRPLGTQAHHIILRVQGIGW